MKCRDQYNLQTLHYLKCLMTIAHYFIGGKAKIHTSFVKMRRLEYVFNQISALRKTRKSINE